MSEKTISTTIEILGKHYPIRCLEAEVAALQQSAAFVNQKMLEVQQSGKAINFERIAVITALNIAHQFLQVDQQKDGMMSKINHHVMRLQEKIDSVMNKPLQTELIYTTE